MKKSNKISLGDSDVGLFSCKLLDGSKNRCGCCFVGRYGTNKSLMSSHHMTAEHTCRLHGLKRVRQPLPEKVEGGLAKNKFWEEVEKPKVSPTSNIVLYQVKFKLTFANGLNHLLENYLYWRGI